MVCQGMEGLSKLEGAVKVRRGCKGIKGLLRYEQ